jgi:hypothetical protein
VDAETLLTFVHDFQELIGLKGVDEDFEQQVQIVRLLIAPFAGNYMWKNWTFLLLWVIQILELMPFLT